MQKTINYIRKELVLRLDFVNMDFEIGLVWIAIILIKIIL
jgi:hypothetical protein